MLDALLSSETTFTISSVIILWAIIGGPMRYMKTRYKLFMFCVATSLLGASLDKIARYSGIDDPEVIALGKALISVARIGMTFIGVYILATWHSQCEQIKDAIAQHTARKEARRTSQAINRAQSDSHGFSAIS